MEQNPDSKVFNYCALRLLVGLIAFALPWVVTFVAARQLTSISASYHTNAQDLFVGMLFVVGAFMWAYNGHTPRQSAASKVAALAALMIALFPTACDDCQPSWESGVHFGAAIVLFSILSYFCFVYFRTDIKARKPTEEDVEMQVRCKQSGELQSAKERQRSGIYYGCGVTMIVCMIAIALSYLLLSDESRNALSITYWGEAIALAAFGVAWMTAGRLRFLADEQDALRFPGPGVVVKRLINNAWEQ